MSTITVDGIAYNTNNLANYHPGGKLFVELFDGKDATEVFAAYHRRKFPHQKLHCMAENNDKLMDEKYDPEYQKLSSEINRILPIHKSFAPWYYYVKILVLLGVTFYTEWNIHVHGAYYWYNMAFLGWLFALVGLNIQHDANHGAISRYFPVNRVLGMTQNWIGGSAIDWMHQHIVQHHLIQH